MAFSNQSVIQVEVKGVALGQAVNNVFHYFPVGVNGTAATAVALIRAAWQNLFLPVIHTNYLVSSYRVVEITGYLVSPLPPPPVPPEPNTFIYGEFAEILGTDPADRGSRIGEMLPSYVAASYRKRTLLAGRKNRGSARIGTISELDVSGNSIIAAALPLFQAAEIFWSDTIALEPPTTLIPCIFHRRDMLTTRIEGLIPSVNFTTRVQSGTINTLVGSQISRKQTPSGPA